MTIGPDTQNVDNAEVDKFDAMAARWWDPEGELHPLHVINPVRLRFIQQYADIVGKKVLDIGCGGGILSESMARAGASVTAIDMAQSALTVARLHAVETGMEIDYQFTSAEQYASSHAGEYDAVTCLELLEHVPDPVSLLESAARLTRPGGRVFVSTINRNLKAYMLAVLGAEYVMQLLPKGTHRYDRFIRPSELAQWARKAGLQLVKEVGLHYNPLFRSAYLTDSVDVNYLMCFEKPED